MSIEYKGMRVEQQSDRSVSVYGSDGMILIHAYVTKVLSEEALERLAARLYRLFVNTDRQRTLFVMADELSE